MIILLFLEYAYNHPIFYVVINRGLELCRTNKHCPLSNPMPLQKT